MKRRTDVADKKKTKKRNSNMSTTFTSSMLFSGDEVETVVEKFPQSQVDTESGLNSHSYRGIQLKARNDSLMDK